MPNASNETIYKVLANATQGLSNSEKARARHNIGALGEDDVGRVAITNNYNDLDNKPDLSIYAKDADISTVGKTGDYNDLENKPVIPGPEVLVVSYGITPLSDITTALSAGKLVVMKYNNAIYALPSRVSAQYVYFSTAWMAGSLFTAGIRHFVCSQNDGWFMYPFRLNGTMDVHLPSVQTARVTTTLQDNYDDWIKIGRLVIGGHGTSSGNIQVGIKACDASMVSTYITDITHRTSSTSDVDNKITYGSISTTANYQFFFMFSQYDGTATVDCSYVINLFSNDGNNPTHTRLTIRKTFLNNHTTLFITAELLWGEPT